MIFYEYLCSECQEVTTINLTMKDEVPKEIPCPRCKGDILAKRVWGNQAIKIPESFKATSELYNGDHGSNFDYISNRMKHGTRPSGRTKTYW